MQLNVVVPGKAKSETIEVSDALFAEKFNESLVHQAVVAYMAAGRAGTKAQKTRAEVSGGGTKPWRQKGTGRARAGSIRSPLWRTGGKIFAAVPRDYTQKINRKMHQGAMRSIFSELARQDRLVVVENLDLKGPKTRELAKMLQDLKLVGNVLLIDNELHENLALASRNIPKVDVCGVNQINPVNLVSFEKVVLTKQAVKQIEEIYG